jgi:acyl-CoA synthetase (AMP-forming)/AMP-acid ligase II
MLSRKLVGWLNPQRLVELAFAHKFTRVWPDREFLLFQEQRLTRRQVFARVRALAAGLQALGIVKGDRVATLLPGCPPAVYAAFLPQVLGSVHVPLNPLLGEHELHHILADCGAKVILTTRSWYGLDHPARLARLLPDLPDLRYVIVCDESEDLPYPLPPLPFTHLTEGSRDRGKGTFITWREVLLPGENLQPTKISADDTVLISYTSGTTGLPKGVVHSQCRYWGLLVRSVSPRLKLSPLRCLLLPFPPYHYAGLFGITVVLLAGGKVILMDRFDPQRMLELIQAEKVSQIGGSPTMYQLLLGTPGQERYDLSSVQRLTFSTEPLSLDLARALHERMGCALENFYGTTESMLISWTGLDDPWERAATTVGRPVPGARLRIVDDQRHPLPAGEQGEIAVQTSQMMTGYYRDPELTAQALDDEGWFYTGDVGSIGEDGCLRLVDRKKDLILRGGQNIYPAEVERYLERHPLVRRAGVIGAPSSLHPPHQGGQGGIPEAVWAYLELYPGAHLTSKEVLNFCRGQIAPFKIPEQVRFVERLPTTATGKVQKFRLRELAAQELSNDGPSGTALV